MRLSQTFPIYAMTLYLYTSFSLNGEILKIICLLSILQKLAGYGELSICFSKGGALKCSSLCAFSQSCRVKLSVCVYLQGYLQRFKLAIHSRGCGIWLQWAWGVPMSQLEGSACKSSQAACLKASQMESMKGVLETLTLCWVLSSASEVSTSLLCSWFLQNT